MKPRIANGTRACPVRSCLVFARGSVGATARRCWWSSEPTARSVSCGGPALMAACLLTGSDARARAHPSRARCLRRRPGPANGAHLRAAAVVADRQSRRGGVVRCSDCGVEPAWRAEWPALWSSGRRLARECRVRPGGADRELRAFSECVISLGLSKMRLMRMSRKRLLHRRGFLAVRLERAVS